MQFRRLALSALTLAAASPFANATPATRVEVQPSAILIFASNMEERSYNCSISFVWSHNDFGTRKSQQLNSGAFVNPKIQNALIFKLAGGYVDVRIESGPSIQCN